MPIIKNHIDFGHDFTMLPNEWVRDSRLSHRARGVLAVVMSHRDGWETSITYLVREGKEGRNAIYTAVDELVSHGYLERVEARSATGKFEGVNYEVRNPHTGNQQPLSKKPYTENPNAEKPYTDNPQQENTNYKKTITKENQLEETRSRKRDGPGYTGEFEAFWKTYPRKNAKAAAFKAWNKLSTEEKQLALTGAQRYAHDPNRVPQFTAHGSTWLNEKRWEDAPLPARSTNQQTYEEKVAYMVNAVNQNNQSAPSLYGELE